MHLSILSPMCLLLIYPYIGRYVNGANVLYTVRILERSIDLEVACPQRFGLFHFTTDIYT